MNQMTLNEALHIFDKDVASLYQQHEATFDLESLHGRFHILRCLFLTDSMMQYYTQRGVVFDAKKVYYATLFHDIAREDNGFDFWENESALACNHYIKSKGYNTNYAQACGNLILKELPLTIEGQLLYDADVLDYHRFFIFEEEQNYFQKERLIFLGNSDISTLIASDSREKIILLAKELVRFTSTMLIETSTSNLIQQLQDHYLKVRPW